MNQTDVIQKLVDTDRQAQAIARDAREARENMDAQIEAEIGAMDRRYRQEAEDYLQKLRKAQEKSAGTHLAAMDKKLEDTLHQVDQLYAAKKDDWVDAIFRRIVGKAED